MEKINYDLTARKWGITVNILEVAIKRRISPQRVRSEILEEINASPSLLSLLEKTDKYDTKNVLTIKMEDRLNAYFSRELKEEVLLNGNRALAV